MSPVPAHVLRFLVQVAILFLEVLPAQLLLPFALEGTFALGAAGVAYTVVTSPREQDLTGQVKDGVIIAVMIALAVALFL